MSRNSSKRRTTPGRAAITAAMLVAGITAVTPAIGQVVTPPPATNPGPADHIPVAPTPPAAAPQAQPAAQPRPVRARPVREPLPDVEFKSIVQRDAQGNMIPLTEPGEVAALRANPLIGPEGMEKIAGYLRDREIAFERLAVNNLDVVETIEGGLFRDVDLAARPAESQEKLKVLKPIFPPSAPAPLTSDLRTKGLISDVAARFSMERVMKEYVDGLLGVTPTMDEAERKKRGANTLMTVTQMQTEETMFAYKRVASRAMADFAAHATKAGISADMIASAKGAASSFKVDLPQDQAHKVYRDATAGWTLDQRRAFLNAALSQ